MDSAVHLSRNRWQTTSSASSSPGQSVDMFSSFSADESGEEEGIEEGEEEEEEEEEEAEEAEALRLPKIEFVDDDGKDLILKQQVLQRPNTSAVIVATGKRPRGRPRKIPVGPPVSPSKLPKARSKTGCITCRRRKKKCDETKPHCLHCQKNNVVCEGYPNKELWRSGRHRSAQAQSGIDRPKELPILIEGVESDLDRRLLDHFNFIVSPVLSLFREEQNPFKEILLPMAIRHRGLMHSLLCLSGAHLSNEDPSPEITARHLYHFDRAISNLRTNKAMTARIDGENVEIIDDPTVAQTLVLCLNTICAGETKGEYRSHLDAARHFVTNQQSSNKEFQKFLIEFFYYHEYCSSITSLDRRSVIQAGSLELPKYMIQPEAGALLGVLDGLFVHLSNITKLRDTIRWRRTNELRPLVDYQALSDAQAIDNDLRGWICCQPEGSPRYYAALLYRQCTWIYLHRTILPSAPSHNLSEAVSVGVYYLQQLPANSSTQSILLMPLFLLGCAAFEEEQRPHIREALDSLHAYSSLGNIKHAKEIVERIWVMMDDGNEESWDWETVMHNMGFDFLIT